MVKEQEVPTKNTHFKLKYSHQRLHLSPREEITSHIHLYSHLLFFKKKTEFIAIDTTNTCLLCTEDSP